MNLSNCIIDGLKTMKDGSLKISLVTRELSPNELAEIFCSLNKEIPEVSISNLIDDNKTPSQRLRDRLYAYYMSEHKDKEAFTNWYINTLDKIGQQYLERINN